MTATIASTTTTTTTSISSMVESNEWILSKEYWEQHGGQVRLWNDGHTPETLVQSSPSSVTNTTNNTITPPLYPCRLIDYPSLYQRQMDEKEDGSLLLSSSPTVHVCSNALPESLVDHIYNVTTSDPNQPAWGDYITIPQVQAFRKKYTNWRNMDYKDWLTCEENEDEEDAQEEWKVAMVSYYLACAMGESTAATRILDRHGSHDPSPDTMTTTTTPLWTAADLQQLAHGVAIWGLSAKEGTSVPYHLDYAEQIRYDSNILVPPLLAGTLQCTKDALEGGDFCVSLEGLEHYQRFGYKGLLVDKEGGDPTSIVDSMVSIPYRYNQLTYHLGHLPHLSTPITRIHGEHGQDRRVIVGFNLFGPDAGPLVAKAPEHSVAFRRKVQRQRALWQSSLALQRNKTGQQQQDKSTSSNISLQAIQRNKPLTKLLVLAKREKIKQEFRMAQAHMLRELPQLVPATVQSLMDHFYPQEDEQQQENTSSLRQYCWPASPVDVQVFLNGILEQGQYRVVEESSSPSCLIKDGKLVSPQATIDLVLPQEA